MITFIYANRVIIGALIFIAGYTLFINNSAYDRGYDAADIKLKMEIQAAKDEAIEKANQKSKEYEATISKMKTVNRKLNARVKDVIKKNDSYAKCLVDDAGLQLYNNSTAKSNDTK